VSGVSAGLAVAGIENLGFTHVVIIPDAETRYLYEALEGRPGLSLLSPAREGEGVAIAAGLWVGGAKPLLVIQNTGLMEAGDTIRGCGLGPRIPLRLAVGWRGYAGATRGQRPIDSAFSYTEPLLEALGIPYRLMMDDGDLAALSEMDRTAAETSMPAAVLFGWAFRP
jgi:sulfopyruvate decarboxylase TPP-binding subunit